MVIPAAARKQTGIRKGDVLSVFAEGRGRLVLVRLELPKPARPLKGRLIRRKGKHPVIDVGRPVTREEIREALTEFP